MTKFQIECTQYQNNLRIKRIQSLTKCMQEAIKDNEPHDYINWIKSKIDAQVSQSVQNSGSSV